MATIEQTQSTTELKDAKFRFKKDKLGNQRPTVELKIAVPTFPAGIAEIAEKGGKGLELLMEVIYDTVRGAVAGYVGDNENAAQDNIPWDKFTWDAIANAPRAERRTISDEVWEAFAKDYIEVMPSVTGKSVEAVTNATVVFLKKFTIVKTNKPVISKLKDQLGLYMEHSKNAEQFAEVLEMLISKADALLAANDVELLVQNL
jgi:hypothetical protein